MISITKTLFFLGAKCRCVAKVTERIIISAPVMSEKKFILLSQVAPATINLLKQLFNQGAPAVFMLSESEE